MLERWQQLWQRRQLLFIPKQYPKFLNNKIRVFTPSLLLKVALLSTSLYALQALVQQLAPSQVVIPYPESPSQPQEK